MSKAKTSHLNKTKIGREEKKDAQAWDNLKRLSKKIEGDWKEKRSARQLITEARR